MLCFIDGAIDFKNTTTLLVFVLYWYGYKKKNSAIERSASELQVLWEHPT
jgi:hypothetical protein